MGISDVSASPWQKSFEISVYFQIAGTTIYIWDHWTSLNNEVTYMWPTKWTLVKTLYTIARFLTPVALAIPILSQTGLVPVSPLGCKILIPAGAVATTSMAATWNAMMAVRAHAIWNRSRSVGISLFVLFVISTSMEFMIVTFEMIRTSATVSASGTKHLHICTGNSTLAASWGYMGCTPSLVFESVIFLVSIYKLRHPDRAGGDSLTRLMIWHSGCYFATLTIFRLTTLLLFIEYGGFYNVSFNMLVGLGSTLMCRMVLELRQSLKRPKTSSASPSVREVYHPQEPGSSLPSVYVTDKPNVLDDYAMQSQIFPSSPVPSGIDQAPSLISQASSEPEPSPIFHNGYGRRTSYTV